MHSNHIDRDAALTAPIPASRSLVPMGAAARTQSQTAHPADARFLASLIASSLNTETVRTRRKLPAAMAVACYRAAQANLAA